MAALKGMAVVK